MKVMIFAAGRGERLKPLTDHIPKPLIPVDGHPVIDHTLARLEGMAVEKIVVNLWHLGEALEAHLSGLVPWQGNILFSHETTLLETGGGVVAALPLLGEEPFLTINGDILWEMDLSPLLSSFDAETMDALLVLVANPPWKKGDFILSDPVCGPIRRRQPEETGGMTYSGIQLLHPRSMASYPCHPFSLNLFYNDAMVKKRLFGLSLPGKWTDVGTPETLAKAREEWKFPFANSTGFK